MTRTSNYARRFFSAVVTFVFFLSALPFLLPGRALDATQTLKVYAQYWADPDSATLLGEYTREQMDEWSYSDIGYEGTYCNVTRVNTVMRTHARGVKLAEFLSQKVGVDLNSVRHKFCNLVKDKLFDFFKCLFCYIKSVNVCRQLRIVAIGFCLAF